MPNGIDTHPYTQNLKFLSTHVVKTPIYIHDFLIELVIMIYSSLNFKYIF